MHVGRRAVLATGLGVATAGALLGEALSASATPASHGPNPRVPGESRALTDLRRRLDEAAAGHHGVEIDEAGRRVVEAESITYLLREPLIIGGDTALHAGTATFVCDYPLVDKIYTADRKNWHSPTPEYPETFTSRAVSGPRSTLLLNHVPSDDIGLYRAPGNIRVEGGIWEPTGHYLKDATGIDLQRGTAAPPMNAITFEHTHDVEVVGVVVRNVKWWHGVEFNAVHTATLSDSRLEGWIEDPTRGVWDGDAVQVDLPGAGNGWAGADDNTPASDVRVRDNYCGPSDTQPGWGKFGPSHDSAPGKVFTDIWIERNTIEDTKWDAILAMNTSRIVIRENEVTNCRGGIYVKAIGENPLTTVDIIGNGISVVSDTGRPTIAVMGQRTDVEIDDVAVYGNRYSKGEMWYKWANFRRAPQR